MKRRNQQAVALIITLVMLSIITFMAVTFLVLSRREQGAVQTATDQTVAALAADTAIERAKVELLASILSTTNEQAVAFTVATNFVNRFGFVTTPVEAVLDATNVNYDYLANGNQLNRDQLLQNLANLWYNPRPPVFIHNPRIGTNEFRYYLDLNRNGRFETNGFTLVMLNDDISNPVWLGTNGAATTDIDRAARHFFTGDPEWIGVLENPNRRHSPTNRFTARYTFAVVPADHTIDVNAVHNQTRSGPNNPEMRRLQPGQPDGFLRNQGVGPWEMNLAAFLVDLNTNEWGAEPIPDPGYYQYNGALAPAPAQPVSNSGRAFDDALALLRYRYAFNYYSLETARDMFPNLANALRLNHIDDYSEGPLMLGMNGLNETPPTPVVEPVDLPWAGAENPNRFFSPQQLFDRSKSAVDVPPPDFVHRLTAPGLRTNTYDRYTFYRLMSQLGVESSPQINQMNLNYVNVDAGGNVIPFYETNQIHWEATQFFTNAAARLLTQLDLEDVAGNPITVTNIPLYPTNHYTPSVHRMLQLAANMYDATTNRVHFANQTNAFEPSMFRPIFEVRDNGAGSNQVLIVGFVRVEDTDPLDYQYWTLPQLSSSAANVYRFLNVHGVPWVVGAKEGFPNFNEVAMQTHTVVSRKLEFRRAPGDNSGPVIQTNQMYLIAISNVFGLEAWNSYSNRYPRGLELRVDLDFTMVITNEVPLGAPLVSNFYTVSTNIFIDADTWVGFDKDPGTLSFRVPLAGRTNYLPASTWRPFQAQQFVPISGVFEQPSRFPVPRWWLRFNTRVRFAMIDHGYPGGPRIVDYVNLDDRFDDERRPPLDLARMLTDGAPFPPNPNSPHPGASWYTNRIGGAAVWNNIDIVTYGIVSQIVKCMARPPAGGWESYTPNAPGTPNEVAIDGFRVNMGLSPTYYPTFAYSKSNLFYAPFNPTRSFYINSSWQANDPLVHYTIADLGGTNAIALQPDNPILANLGRLNRRYDPWGGNPGGGTAEEVKYELGVKDPLVRRSDDWNFPGGKFPSVGWLGRVHRGTPWQTVYMKGRDVEAETQNTNTWPNYAYANKVNRRIAEQTYPTKDWEIFDSFTAAINASAASARMSVNQSNLAAWSAVLSGVLVLTNNVTDDEAKINYLNATPSPPGFTWRTIEPAGIYVGGDRPPVAEIVDSINRVRRSFSKDTFSRVGQVLAASALSDESPFLRRNQDQREFGISEEMYERIPQQIMGLLTVSHSPRFVVYAYGQTLRPAPNSLITSGNFALMCTNYQVTAETATRTVFRVEGSPNPRYKDRPDALGRRYPPKIVVEQFNVLPPD